MKNEAQRKWQKNNPDKIKEINRRYAQSEKGKAANKRSHERMMADPERRQRAIERHREWNRKFALAVQGKHQKVNKRPRPESCELCKWGHKILHYHHWDDNNPELGLWLCGRCHTIVGGWEKNIIAEYLKLKEQITNIWTLRDQQEEGR